MKKVDRTILVILDGWGHGPNPAVSAIAQAKTPYVDSLYDQYPNAELTTYGEQVGLPEGQMGNSEVGHLNIGAGRVVYQELARINKAIREKTLAKVPSLQKALAYAKENNKKVHLLGLVSDGGVHSHIDHLKALCDITTAYGLSEVFIHAFLDGRDTAPQGGQGYLKELLTHIEHQPVALASVIGRYYAMDRDQRWERVKLAYDLLVKGEGKKTSDILQSVAESYAASVTDEFMEPLVCTQASGEAVTTIAPDDLVIFFNFRTDRPRELTTVLSQKDFPEYEMKKLPLYFLTMTRYDQSFEGVELIFDKEDLSNTLGELLAKAGKTQVRIAETEKYPHVSFFMSGGREATFEGERRIMIPSPKVATYDLQPEMSARALTAAIIEDIEKHLPDFICLNYANTDMVGHTGVFEAAIKAAETVDDCLRQLMEVCLAHDYAAVIIADHGNSDYMINEDGTAHTAHTMNPVPCFLVSQAAADLQLKDGKLADVAPTILALMDMSKAAEMDGSSLLVES